MMLTTVANHNIECKLSHCYRCGECVAIHRIICDVCRAVNFDKPFFLNTQHQPQLPQDPLGTKFIC